MMADVQLVLPTSVMSPTDIARLLREIESVDNFFREATIRESGTPNKLPRLSKLMDQLVTENKLNLLQSPDRVIISSQLQSLRDSAPVMHISFSTDPPGSHVQKIVVWLRSNVHPSILVTVGLQPNIGAGCIVRTTNKLFDFSLREYFAQKRGFFIKKLHESITDESAVAPQQNPAAPQPIVTGAAPAVVEAPAA